MIFSRFVIALAALAAFAMSVPVSAQAAAKYNLNMTITGTVPVSGLTRPLAAKVTRKNLPLPVNKKVFCASAKNFYTPKVRGVSWRVIKCGYNARKHTGNTTLQGNVVISGVPKVINLDVAYKYAKVARSGGSVTTTVTPGASNLTIKVKGKFQLLGVWQPFSSSVLRRNVTAPANRAAFCAAAQNFKPGGTTWRVKNCTYNAVRGIGTVKHLGNFTTTKAVNVPVNFTAKYVYSPALARPTNLVVVRKVKRNILRWTAVTGAKSYIILRKGPGQPSLTVYRKNIKRTVFVDRKVKRKKLYTYAVVATDNKTDSLRSKSVRVRTR